MTILCQTNFMPDVRSCTIKGDHEPTCDGFGYEWSEEKHTDIATGRECTGCAPRPASHGFVCNACYEMILAAVSAYGPWQRALEGVLYAVTPEPGGGGAVGYTPHTALQLDSSVLATHYASYPGHLETWLSTAPSEHGGGVEDAIRFGVAMSAAARRHEIREAATQLVGVRCPQCKRRNLVRVPPGMERQHLKVACRCGWTATEGDTTHSFRAVEGGFERIEADKIATLEAIEEYVKRRNLAGKGR